MIRLLTLALALVLVTISPALADIAVANSTSCVFATGASGKLSCPLSKTPSAGNVLVAFMAGAGGSKCSIFAVGFTIVDFAPLACYSGSYYVVDDQPQSAVTFVSQGDTDALVAVVLEVSGIGLKGTIVDNHSMFTELSPPSQTCAAHDVYPSITNDGVFSYAVNPGAVALKTYATTPDTQVTSYSAAATDKNPVRIDVGFSVLPEKFTNVFGTFTYNAEMPSACAMMLLAP